MGGGGPGPASVCVVIFGSCEWSCFCAAMGGVSVHYVCVCMLERTGSRLKDWPSSGASSWHVRKNTCDFSFQSVGASVEPTSERRRQSCLHCSQHVPSR